VGQRTVEDDLLVAGRSWSTTRTHGTKGHARQDRTQGWTATPRWPHSPGRHGPEDRTHRESCGSGRSAVTQQR
jgi:hypothetical protein